MEQKQDENALQVSLQQLYNNQLSQKEADEATLNLTGLFEVLLEIHEERGDSHATSE